MKTTLRTMETAIGMIHSMNVLLLIRGQKRKKRLLLKAARTVSKGPEDMKRRNSETPAGLFEQGIAELSGI